MFVRNFSENLDLIEILKMKSNPSFILNCRKSPSISDEWIYFTAINKMAKKIEIGGRRVDHDG